MEHLLEKTNLKQDASDAGFYRTLIEKTLDGIAVITLDGSMKFSSPAVKKMLGYSKTAYFTQNLFSLVHPDDKSRCSHALEQLIAEPAQPVLNTVRFQHRDGSWKYLEAKAVNLAGDASVQGILINLREATERLHVQQALMESEERYRNLIENSFDGITIIDFAGIVKYHSPALKNILGYTPVSGLGKSILSLLHPADHSLFFDSLPVLKKYPGKLVTNIVRFKHKNETWVTLETRLVNFTQTPGIEGILINYRDITESEQIKAALLESEERNRNIAETAPETIFIVDADLGKIIDCNANAEKLYGFSREQLLRMDAIELSPEYQPDGKNSLEAAREKLRIALKGGNPVYEWYHKNANGRIFPAETRLVRFPPYNKKYIRGTINDISGRKALEEKLKQREKDYHHLASVSPVGIFKTDTKGRTTYVNEKWCEITGLSAKQATGTGWQKAIHPEDRLKSLKGWKHAFKEQKNSNAVFRFVTPKGKTSWVYGQAVPDKDEEGNLIGYVGSVTDITDRMQAIRALSESEKRNSALLQAIPDMIFRLSKSGVFLDFKAAAGFGPLVSPELFLGKKIENILPRTIAQLCMKYLKRALHTNTTQAYNYSLPDQKNPGKLSYYEARIVPNNKEDAMALIRDITQQKEAELSLKSSEERWKSLVKSAPLYVVTINSKDEITFVNNLRGMKSEEVIGANVLDFAHSFSIDVSAVRKALAKARKENYHSMEISLSHFRKGSDAWFNVISSPIKHNGKVEDLIVMALDITELKVAERDLRVTNDKLKALYQRMETIREEEKKHIAMEIHDELGQQLTAMKLGMFWMQQYIAQHRKTGLEAALIDGKVKSLIELSGQSINSVRKLAHQLRPVVLDTLGLIPAIEWQIKAANENHQTHCRFSHNVNGVYFLENFSVALFRIIQESLTNILRHARAEKASVTLQIKEGRLSLNIRDNGIGIKQQDLSHPDKFGIFGMKERMKTWNGVFELSNMRGKGTSLHFTFPLHQVVKKYGKHRVV